MQFNLDIHIENRPVVFNFGPQYSDTAEVHVRVDEGGLHFAGYVARHKMSGRYVYRMLDGGRISKRYRYLKSAVLALATKYAGMEE